MTPPPITKVDRGGIATLADIKLRCRIDPEDHWLWTMATMHNRGTIPVCQPRWEKQRVAVRRVVLQLQGKELPNGWVAYRTCSEPLCCNPEHVKAGPRAKAVTQSAALGVFDTPRFKHARIQLGKQRRRFTPEQVRAIRQDTRPARAIAEDFDCSRQSIIQIRSFRSYRDVPLGGSVFDLASLTCAAATKQFSVGWVKPKRGRKAAA
jgi:hypothetical protein